MSLKQNGSSCRQCDSVKDRCRLFQNDLNSLNLTLVVLFQFVQPPAGIGEDKKKESVVNINLDPNISESEVTVNVSVPNVTINIASRKGPKEINPAKDDEVSDTSP